MELRLARGGLLRVRAWRGDGRPAALREFTVEGSDSGRWISTDADGRFNVRLHPGRYELALENEDRDGHTVLRTVDIVEGETLELVIRLP